ncbi:hypothetical protein ACFW2X_07245 [Streptomyces antibioticus]
MNEIVTGLIGVPLIAASFVSSVRRNRAPARADTEVGPRAAAESAV